MTKWEDMGRANGFPQVSLDTSRAYLKKQGSRETNVEVGRYGQSKWVPTSIVRYVTSILEEAGFPQDECRSGKIWAEQMGSHKYQ